MQGYLKNRNRGNKRKQQNYVLERKGEAAYLGMLGMLISYTTNLLVSIMTNISLSSRVRFVANLSNVL